MHNNKIHNQPVIPIGTAITIMRAVVYVRML